MAEVYWDLEWTLQQQGFDYTYDKRLYDRLRERHARPVREHFWRGPGLPGQAGPLPGEPRRAAGRRRRSRRGVHEAAAVDHVPVAGPAVLPPGAVRGPQEARSRRISCREPDEPVDPGLRAFYDGCWPCCGSPSSATASGNCWNAARLGRQLDLRLLRGLRLARPDGERLLVAVNYAANQSQCYVRLPFADLGGRTWRLQDQLGTATYDRDGDGLQARGLYLDMTPMGYHAFEVSPIG